MFYCVEFIFEFWLSVAGYYSMERGALYVV